MGLPPRADEIGKKGKRKGCRELKKLLAAGNVLFFVWGIVSYIEIISKNLNPDPTYNPLNLIVLTIKAFS